MIPLQQHGWVGSAKSDAHEQELQGISSYLGHCGLATATSAATRRSIASALRGRWQRLGLSCQFSVPVFYSVDYGTKVSTVRNTYLLTYCSSNLDATADRGRKPYIPSLLSSVVLHKRLILQLPNTTCLSEYVSHLDRNREYIHDVLARDFLCFSIRSFQHRSLVGGDHQQPLLMSQGAFCWRQFRVGMRFWEVIPFNSTHHDYNEASLHPYKFGVSW